MSKLNTLTNGIIKENPVLVLVLGTCPTLAVSTQVSNAFGMGAAATVVLLCSNIFISLLRKVIPDKVRIPCYIVLIASFVTIVQMVLHAYVYEIYKALGLYLPLIVVNCIILGRAEAFANKNSVIDSALDAIGMGVGFTLTLFVMASIREIFGNGTWMGIAIPVLAENHISLMTMAPGGFFVFGLLIAAVNKFFVNKPVKKDFGCEGCPSAEACGGAVKS
ncbi:MAG: electron transport complex subunit E [Oscillospiraceae bacterium]|nr:electron transport complex subunit E [Oscillospiraceae bacterium]